MRKRIVAGALAGATALAIAGGVMGQQPGGPPNTLIVLGVKAEIDEIRKELGDLVARLERLSSELERMADPRWLEEERMGSNEAAAIGALRTMTTAQAIFREADKDRDGVLDYATSLRELQDANLIDQVLGAGVKQGYRFRIIAADEMTWSADAAPDAPGKTGQRSFFVDESGVIRFDPEGRPPNANSAAIGG